MRKLGPLETIVLGAACVGGAVNADAATLRCTYDGPKTDTMTAYVSNINPDSLPADAPVDYEISVQKVFDSIEQEDGSFSTAIYLNDNLKEQYVRISAMRDGVEGPMSTVASRILDSPVDDYDAPATAYVGIDGNGDFLFATSEAFCIGGDKRTFYEPVAGVSTVPKEKFENAIDQFASLSISDSQDNVAELKYMPWTFSGRHEEFDYNSDKNMVDISLGSGLEDYVGVEFPSDFSALPSNISSGLNDDYLMGIPIKSTSSLGGLSVDISNSSGTLSYSIANVDAGGGLSLIDLANGVVAGDINTFDWSQHSTVSINIPVGAEDNNVSIGETFYTDGYGVLTKNLAPGQYVTDITESDYVSNISAKLPRRSLDTNPIAAVTGSDDIGTFTGDVHGSIELSDLEYSRMKDMGVSVVYGQGSESLTVQIPKSELEAGINFIGSSTCSRFVDMTNDFNFDASCDWHALEVNTSLSARTAYGIGSFKMFNAN